MTGLNLLKVLHEGRLAEMRTGEGKTLVAVLPAYLNALAGKGVQVPIPALNLYNLVEFRILKIGKSLWSWRMYSIESEFA